MKIGWGYRITFLYIGFVIIIATLVIGSMKQDIELVSDDYYEKELNYQERIEQIKRTDSLTTDIEVTLEEKKILITYPEADSGSYSGKIVLFRPSDRKLDMNYEVNAGNDQTQVIQIADLRRGMYRLQIEYTLNALDYYFEKQVVIP